MIVDRTSGITRTENHGGRASKPACWFRPRNGAAQLCIFEQWVAPGAGAPTHSHPVEEVLTVREGEAEMWIDERSVSSSRPDSR